jgi:hypothetical protein
MSRAWIVLATLVAAGCSATVSREGIANVPGEEVWKTEVELELGEQALVDGGALELTLVASGIDRATVLVQGGGGRRQEELRTGPGGSLQHPPYEIRLLSTGIDGSARLQVRRQWGQQG